MATLRFLDPPKSAERHQEESERETDPTQDRFRQELPQLLLILTALIITLIIMPAIVSFAFMYVMTHIKY